MILFKHSKDLQSHLYEIKKHKKSIGFVPTMGALHKGHLSLISESLKDTDVTVCSIFVNPTQFNNKEDFIKYPNTIENDILLLEQNGCDILLFPDEHEMYPDENSMSKHFKLGHLENILEGKFRPGHFQGVCLVMERLINIVHPDSLFLGQKDYQQCLVIKKLVTMMHTNIKIKVCPILREESGLAMSSRNLRLNEVEKKSAAYLYKTLSSIKEDISDANFFQLKKDAISNLESIGFKVDYLELANVNNLEIVQEFSKTEKYIILIAAFLNAVRLIDNLMVTG
jgi:pantoate--beta-alanine ligase